MRAALVFALILLFPAAASAEDEQSLDLGGTPSVELQLRRVPKGSFTQGSAPSEPGHEKDEEGPRPVTITHDFWLGKVPITRGQFSRFVADTHYVTEAEKGGSGGYGWDGKALVQKKEFTWRSPGFPQGDDHPVVMVTFGDAIAFTAWASRKTSKRVRLPTEAEWEYAARANTTTPWPGAKTEEEASAIGWFKTVGTHPVGQKKPNAFGLFDMSGEVYEWCHDIYAPYTVGPAIDPDVTTHVEGEPERRVLRGGSWLKDPKRGRSAARFRNTPGSRNADNGFRVVVTDEDATGPNGAASGEAHAAAPSATTSSAPPDTTASARPTTAAPASNESMGWLLLAAPIAAASAVVAWMLGRRRGRTTTSVSGATTRATDDGFFVRVPNAAPGSRVRYSAVVNGTEVTDVVPLDGAEETFVYTGAPPKMIAILEIVLAPAGYRAPDKPVVPPARRSTPPPVPQRPPTPMQPPPARNVLVVPPPGQLLDDDSPSPPPPAPAPAEPFLGLPRAY